MKIDRRNVTTGLAATVAATSLPALAALAALYGIRRFDFVDGPIFSNFLPYPPGFRSCVFDSLWHYDGEWNTLWLIRHMPTGLTFRLAPQPHDSHAVRLVFIEAPVASWPDGGALLVIGRAARSTAVHASLIVGCRPWHKGAVFFRYRPVDPRDPYFNPATEDAPALS